MNPNRPNEVINPHYPQQEFNPNEPIKQQDEEKYRDIEIDPARRPVRPNQYPYQQQSPIQQAQPVQPPIAPTPQNPPVDMVKQVKSMISSGYTPSLDLIQDTANLAKDGNETWANTWFAVLLQKLVKNKKH